MELVVQKELEMRKVEAIPVMVAKFFNLNI
jgi:hypothetical protein